MIGIADIEAARANVYRHLPRTPLYPYPGLSELVGAEVWIKHENHLPTCAFKVRGGVNLASQLDPAARPAGLFTASTGNHGQSIAFAGRVTSTPVTVAVPVGANPDKVAAMRRLGAEVVEHGPDFDTAREWVAGVAAERGGRFIGPTDEELIAGVGTYALEIFEDLPDVDAIIVPVGAGSGATGCCLVASARNPDVEVIAVQAERAPTQYLSWKAGRPVEAPMETRAEGVATRVPFENTQRVMRESLAEFVLVGEAEMERAIRLLFEHTHNVAEDAGAASLAAAIRLGERGDRLAGRKLALVLSGGNLTAERMSRILR